MPKQGKYVDKRLYDHPVYLLVCAFSFPVRARIFYADARGAMKTPRNLERNGVYFNGDFSHVWLTEMTIDGNRSDGLYI